MMYKKATVLLGGIAACCMLHSPATAATYDYKQQGEDWGDVCASGTEQSPVDINLAVTAAPSYSTMITDVSGYTSFTVAQNGHSVQVTPKGLADFIAISNEYYNLEQYHFHAKSEHRLGSSQKDMEVHLLFRSSMNMNKLAVFGFLFESVSSSSTSKVDIPAITTLSKMGLTTTPSSTESNDKSLDILSDLLDTVQAANTKLYTYDGSLTTPPCSEIVRWYVFGEPIDLDESVIDPLIASMLYDGTKGNYRDNRFANNTNTQYLTTYERLTTDSSRADSRSLFATSLVFVVLTNILLFV